MLETLLNFLENSVPDPAINKEAYQFEKGWHLPKVINFGLLMNIIR
jgi:hypothetical protein